MDKLKIDQQGLNGGDKPIWTVPALKEHLEKLMESIKEQFDRLLFEHVKSSEIALASRGIVIDKHLADLNHEAERLSAMKDTYVLKSSYELQHENMRQDYTQRIDTVLTLIKSIQEEIKSLQLTRAELSGKATQSSVIWVGIVTAISIVLTLISMVHEFTK